MWEQSTRTRGEVFCGKNQMKEALFYAVSTLMLYFISLNLGYSSLIIINNIYRHILSIVCIFIKVFNAILLAVPLPSIVEATHNYEKHFYNCSLILSISKSYVSKVKIVWGFSKFLCVAIFVLVHYSLGWLFAEVLIRSFKVQLFCSLEGFSKSYIFQ